MDDWGYELLPTGAQTVVLVPEQMIAGEDQDETVRLQRMLADAKAFIASHPWCPPRYSFFLAFGIGDVIAIFQVRFSQKAGGTDDRLWVVVGDLPSAYLVVEANDNARKVLSRYCDMMEGWVRAVETSSGLDTVFPVPVDPTQEHADMLSSRIRFLRSRVMPIVSDNQV